MAAVTLKQVVDHVAAMEGPDVDRHRIAAIVRETLSAVGLLVNARNDEVYSPAPAPSSRIPGDNWRAASGGRRRR